MIRRTLQITSLAFSCSRSVAACGKEGAGGRPPPPPPPPAAPPRRRRRPRRPRPHPRRRRRRRSPRSRSSRKKTLEQLNAERPARRRLLRPRLLDHPRRRARRPVEERRLSEALDDHPHQRRRPLRRARHRGVQPGARRTPRRAVKDYLVGLGIAGRSHHHRLQGQGSAGLHRVRTKPAGSRTAADTSCSPRSSARRRGRSKPKAGPFGGRPFVLRGVVEGLRA